MKLKTTCTAVLAIATFLVSAGAASEPIVEKDSEGNPVYSYHHEPVRSPDPPLPCPSLGGNSALVVYFFKDGTFNFSETCPGTTDLKPTPEPPDVGELKVEYLKEGTDPCYRFRSGTQWYYRCW